MDCVRPVRLVPEGPEKTRLITGWNFPTKTLAQPGCDAAKIVIKQDSEATEMTHCGKRSPAFKAARLMPEEYEIHRFHQWDLNQMERRK